MFMGLGLGTHFNNNRSVKLVDYFNRNSSNVVGKADTGQTWQVLSGTWATNGEKIYPVSDVNSNTIIIDPGITNYKVSALLYGQFAVVNDLRYLNIVFHCLDINNYMFTRAYANSIELYKIVNGSVMKIGNYYISTPDQFEYTITVICKGLNVKVFFNNIECINYDLNGTETSTFPNYSSVGFRLSRGGNPTIIPTADNFMVEEV